MSPQRSFDPNTTVNVPSAFSFTFELLTMALSDFVRAVHSDRLESVILRNRVGRAPASPRIMVARVVEMTPHG
jgi:hypothetical protein